MAEKTKPLFLDEAVPVGVYASLESELLWDDCCANCPDDPFMAWEMRKSSLTNKD